MVVFPETWLPGYPTFVWRLPPGAGMGKTDELYALSQANSVDLGKGGLAPLQEAARDNVVLLHQPEEPPQRTLRESRICGLLLMKRVGFFTGDPCPSSAPNLLKHNMLQLHLLYIDTLVCMHAAA